MKSGYFSEDIKEFISLLHELDVKYLIVGGEAVIYYGYPRLTGDVDFFYDADENNVAKLFKVLLEFWDNDIPGIKDEKELRVSGYVIQFGVPPNRIDIMNSIDGVDFKEAWDNKKTEYVEISDLKTPIYFLGLKQLIKNKRDSARQKDLDDLEYLSKLIE